LTFKTEVVYSPYTHPPRKLNLHYFIFETEISHVVEYITSEKRFHGRDKFTFDKNSSLIARVATVNDLLID